MSSVESFLENILTLIKKILYTFYSLLFKSGTFFRNNYNGNVEGYIGPNAFLLICVYLSIDIVSRGGGWGFKTILSLENAISTERFFSKVLYTLPVSLIIISLIKLLSKHKRIKSWEREMFVRYFSYYMGFTIFFTLIMMLLIISIAEFTDFLDFTFIMIFLLLALIAGGILMYRIIRHSINSCFSQSNSHPKKFRAISYITAFSFYIFLLLLLPIEAVLFRFRDQQVKIMNANGMNTGVFFLKNDSLQSEMKVLLFNGYAEKILIQNSFDLECAGLANEDEGYGLLQIKGVPKDSFVEMAPRDYKIFYLKSDKQKIRHLFNKDVRINLSILHSEGWKSVRSERGRLMSN